MSAPKSICPDCRLPWAEHLCDDDEVTDGTGTLLKAAPGEEPPGAHVFRYPEEPQDGPAPEY